jgi:hypothetical protein
MTQFDEDFNLPEPLRRTLKGMYGQEAGGAGARIRDAEILAAARRAGEAAHTRRYWRWAGAVGMAAAVALAAGILWRELGTGPTPAPETPAYVRTGDIRDAFYLARQIKAADTSGKPVPKALEGAWDANRDGVIDERDVRVLALAAVKVDGGAEKGVTP